MFLKNKYLEPSGSLSNFRIQKMFTSSHPDMLGIEKAKKTLKVHEQALMNVISKLSNASNREVMQSGDHRMGNPWMESKDRDTPRTVGTTMDLA